MIKTILIDSLLEADLETDVSTDSLARYLEYVAGRISAQTHKEDGIDVYVLTMYVETLMVTTARLYCRLAGETA